MDEQIEWSKWSQHAVDSMNDKIKTCLEQFSLDSQPYSWDLDDALIVFHRSKDQVVADLTVIGTAENLKGQFTWAWANQELPESVTKDVGKLKEFGQTHGVDYLTSPSFSHLPVDAMELLSVSGYLLEAENIFADEIDGEIIYFSMKNFRIQ